jgi:hypothetical protein
LMSPVVELKGWKRCRLIRRSTGGRNRDHSHRLTQQFQRTSPGVTTAGRLEGRLAKRSTVIV